MFFNSSDEIFQIAKNSGTAIFVVPNDLDVVIKNAVVLAPENKSVITIEQVRNMLAVLSMRQTEDLFVLIRPADMLSNEAAAAFLKSLEEPKDKVHFVLVTANLSRILPTILSRSKVYFLRQKMELNKLSVDDEKVKILAKQLIAANSSELVDLAEKIAKHKDNPRSFALEILGTAIEMLSKGYLINQKVALLKKIDRFILAYDNISTNGHIKLHLVADLC